jgi:hypothetical protein
MWNISPKVTSNANASSSTSGWKTRSAGVKDATGKIRIYQTDSGAPQLVIGTAYDVELHIDASGSNYYSGSILVESFDGYEVDLNEGKEVYADYTWGANGAITATGDVPALA